MEYISGLERAKQIVEELKYFNNLQMSNEKLLYFIVALLDDEIELETEKFEKEFLNE